MTKLFVSAIFFASSLISSIELHRKENISFRDHNNLLLFDILIRTTEENSFNFLQLIDGNIFSDAVLKTCENALVRHFLMRNIHDDSSSATE